jgi:WS/DGAT/MGAT family acyltransferase
VSELLGQPLDPARPPWDLWILEGLEGGRVAYAFMMSHALADGGASRVLMEHLFDAPGEAPAVPLARLPREARPSRLAVTATALVDATRELARELPRLLSDTLRAPARLRERETDDDPRRPPLTRLRSPWTPFGGPLRRGRRFDFATTSLTEALEIRKVFGCTVGDVVLAATAGGVRGYLLERGMLPGLPTLGHMAISVRGEDDPEMWGNRVAVRPVALPTQLDDPLARLRACSLASRRAQEEVELLGAARLEEWQRRLPPGFDKGLAGLARMAVRLRNDLTGGVIISNVRGPTRPLRAPGGPVERFVSVGHMKYTAGLNTTVWSYGGELNFAFYAGAEAVPDLARMACHVSAAFEDLQKAAAREATRIPDAVGEETP